MASPSALSVPDAPFSHVPQSVAKPTSCCDANSPRPDPAHINDASKRKRVNRNAKLRQYKLDARREQWLSQVNSKHGKTNQEPLTEVPHVEQNKDDPGEVVLPENHICVAGMDSKWLSFDSTERRDTSPSHVRIRRPEGVEKENSKHDLSGSSGFEFGDSNSSANSCMSDCSEADSSPKSCGDKSPKGKVTRMARDARGFRGRSVGKFEKEGSVTERQGGPGKEGGDLGRFVSIFDNGSYGNAAEGDRLGPDSEDDWEAAADALDLNPPNEKDFTAPQSQSTVIVEDNGHLHSQSVTTSVPQVIHGSLQVEYRNKAIPHPGVVRSASARAWRHDDFCRPTCLPSLGKQYSLPANAGCCQQQWSPIQRTPRNPPSAPLQCPICTEELDSTDSSFDPCSCGFQLCLFCHHRIALEDGRCPGCRKPYCTDISVKPAPSLSPHSQV